MEILDHFEKAAPSLTITWKTHLAYITLNFLLTVGVLVVWGLGILGSAPLLESPLGWTWIVAVYVLTFFFYKKIIQQTWKLLLSTTVAWIVGGAVSLFVVAVLLRMGRDSYLGTGILLWLIYSFITWGIFRLVQLVQKKRKQVQ